MSVIIFIFSVFFFMAGMFAFALNFKRDTPLSDVANKYHKVNKSDYSKSVIITCLGNVHAEILYKNESINKKNIWGSDNDTAEVIAANLKEAHEWADNFLDIIANCEYQPTKETPYSESRDFYDFKLRQKYFPDEEKAEEKQTEYQPVKHVTHTTINKGPSAADIALGVGFGVVGADLISGLFD